MCGFVVASLPYTPYTRLPVYLPAFDASKLYKWQRVTTLIVFNDDIHGDSERFM